MKEKYIEDYMDELHGLFPEVPKEELQKMMLDISSRLTKYVKRGSWGFVSQVQQEVNGKKKRYKFQVDRAYGWDNLRYLRTKARIIKKVGTYSRKRDQKIK
jgi:hypothetical protein